MELLYQPQLFIGRIRSKNPPYLAFGLKMMCTYLFSLTFVVLYFRKLPSYRHLISYVPQSIVYKTNTYNQSFVFL